MKHLLSILLPVYNGEKYLHTALQSICDSPVLEHAEVLAIDDGSTDGSLDVLKSYQQQLPLQILTPERTGNWVVNTNRAAAEARGDYLCFLHQDDKWLPNRGPWISEILSETTPPDFFFSSAVFLNPQNRTVGTWSLPFSRNTPEQIDAVDWFRPLLVQNNLAIGAPVFRRKRYLDFGGLDLSFPYTADWKLWLHFASKCPARFTREPTVGFRIHPESQTVSLSEFSETYRQQMQVVFEEYSNLLPDTPENRPWKQAGRLSLDMNCLLAEGLHGTHSPVRRICRLLLRSSPPLLFRYLRYSRVIQRVKPRLFLTRPSR